MSAKFEGGKNIAMKVPPHQFDATVQLYRDVLKFERLAESTEDSVGFKFGVNNLWIDRVSAVSQAELWLQVLTDNTSEAAKTLSDAGITRCDEIEDLDDTFDGYWISSPSSIVHLVNAKTGA